MPSARKRHAVFRPLETIHGHLVHGRRVRVLAEAIAQLVPKDAHVVDVGCGDGALTRLISETAGNVRIDGYDLFARRHSHTEVQTFDGRTLPLGDDSVDLAMFIDVLHHAEDGQQLLREGVRVSRQAVIVKDHLLNGPVSGALLSFMDWVGNFPHGVSLDCDYWTEEQWRAVWERLGLEVERYQTRLGLYPAFARPVLEDGLHFLAKLRVSGKVRKTRAG